jgi:5-(carboxyamino)imidazole ribonucleotide synthase
MTNICRLLEPIPPGGTIGILGGGQLGRMLALAAARLGLKTHVYSDEADAPAFQVCAVHTQAAYDDSNALRAFATSCDAITFEFENVPSATVALLARTKAANPNARALEVAQERFAEKTFVKELGIGTAEFARADTLEEARKAFGTIGAPSILKTRRMGYDGKGQAEVARIEDLEPALASLNGAPAILESFVEFAFEASVVAARGADGSFAAYDPPENLHANHILRRSTVPGRLNATQAKIACGIARTIAEALDYVGVLCVELFVTNDGALLVNEIAPRVHNSGHWTLEACAVSQFEQHIRAVAGWPLGDPSRHADVVMENIIGEEARDWLALASRQGALHLYGKTEIRAGRKMGHMTRLSLKSAAHSVG